MKILLSKNHWIIFICFISLNAKAQETQENIRNEIKQYINAAPFKMPAPELPAIPQRTDSITTYGAIGDGETLNTKAIQQTINTCADNGGGKVVIPAGLWLTAPIELKSNIELHLDEGAILLFTKDHTQFPIITTPGGHKYFVMSPIYGYKLHDIAITGSGIINGSGDSWRPLKKSKATDAQWKNLQKSGGVVSSDGSMWWPSEEAMNGEDYLKKLKKKDKEVTADDYLPARDYLRPYMVLLNGCKKILINGPTFMNSPKFGFVPQNCTNLVVRNLKINNEWYAQNGDGMDIINCKNVLIYKCTVNAGDDGICMKSSRSSSDTSGNASLQNIVIADCKVYHAHGGFVIGSNTDGGMENISVKNCSYINTDVGIRIKSDRTRGGLVHHIFIDGIYMNNIQDNAIVFDSYYEQKNPERKQLPVTPTTPRFQDFYFNNIYCASAGKAISITGLPESPVDHIYFNNVNIHADKGNTSVDATNIIFNQVKVNGMEL
jgi:polygalacturonase